ncbi:MAG: cytochrome c [Planctomycetia bacterium]|nr:cytochrome c [Planctomycetia bacterium]
MIVSRFLLLAICVAGLTAGARGGEPLERMTPAERGYHWLTTKAYLPPDFDDEVFDSLWKVWPASLQEQAKSATPAERRKLAFSRYGLIERPGSDGTGPALGYLSDGKGGWVMNCLACHSGKVAGQPVLGAPNSNFALETLVEEVRQRKLQLGRPLAHLDKGGLTMPLGTTRGTTNSVMFGVALGSLRDKDLNMRRELKVPKLVHNDADPPAFWNVRRKSLLYAEGFAVKSHRLLLQFVMLPRNSGETLRGWENEFRDILAWIESLEPPRYRWEIDQGLAQSGKVVFEQSCAKCHGTYGDAGRYPNRIVPIDEVQTDPLRLKSLTTGRRQDMRDSWFGDYGREEYVVDPQGYVAPPLNGIWASAPYLHNGSVPTLWHMLHPSDRPTVWRRTEDGYDRKKVGLEVTVFDRVPGDVKSAADQREYFDTQRSGKSAAGHLFPDELTEDEKQAVLEYLKTL